MDIRAAKAVVTGGASGLGAGVGRYLASRGAQVTLALQCVSSNAMSRKKLQLRKPCKPRPMPWVASICS